MKMTGNDYNKLKISITTGLMDKELNLRHLTKDYSDKGLSDMRLRWDLTRLNPDTLKLICGFYDYLNDDHIDTALKKIVKDLIHF